MSKSSLLAVALTATLLAPAAYAQKSGGGVLHRAAVPPHYLLQPGDQLEIQVDSLPEAEKIYQVRADGSINHPVAGEIMVAGKPLKQVADVVKQRLTYCLRKPSFRIGIYSVAEIDVSAIGEVKNQGKYHVNAGASVLDLLALAGGPTIHADLQTVTLMRGEEALPLNLIASNRKELSKIKLVNGDMLNIEAGKRISVLGEVREPGTYSVSVKSLDPIEDALKMAGGTKETAALNRVLLGRASERKPWIVDLNKRDEQSHVVIPETAKEVADGDTVTVQPTRCAVLGGVDKQGQVILTGNETLFDIVSAAGASHGRLDEVCVIRAAEVDAGSDKREVYNLQEAFTDHKSIPKVAIYDGDVVFVPPQDQSGGIMNSLSPMMNIVWMARSLFAF